jgi:hemin uptake protein HemP
MSQPVAELSKESQPLNSQKQIPKLEGRFESDQLVDGDDYLQQSHDGKLN